LKLFFSSSSLTGFCSFSKESGRFYLRAGAARAAKIASKTPRKPQSRQPEFPFVS